MARGIGKEQEPEGFVPFWTTGEAAQGEYHCAECGYGIAVYRELPLCPMCGGTSWEQSTWRRLIGPLDRGSDRGSDRSAML